MESPLLNQGLFMIHERMKMNRLRYVLSSNKLLRTFNYNVININ